MPPVRVDYKKHVGCSPIKVVRELGSDRELPNILSHMSSWIMHSLNPLLNDNKKSQFVYEIMRRDQSNYSGLLQ